jgi:peptide/nickel transport system substrate-binding protein
MAVIYMAVALALALADGCGGDAAESVAPTTETTATPTTQDPTTTEGPESVPTDAAPPDAVLRVGASAATAFDASNPFVAGWTTPFSFIYPTLVQWDEELNIAPGFAEAWEISPDGQTITFTTVADAQWSDGEPLTAGDVAWTINTLVKYREGGAASLATFTIPTVESAEAPDDTTVVVRFATTTGTGLSGLASMFILPEHVWAEHATGPNGEGLTEFPADPPLVSGGPFIWTEFTKDEFARFETNPNWYGDTPKIAGFGVRFYANEDAMIQALRAGEIDAVDFVSPANAVALADDPALTTVSVDGLLVDTWSVNSNPAKPEHQELADPLVREALDLAINRAEIVNVVYGGLATEGGSILPAANGIWFAQDLLPLPYDPDGANAILDDLGYLRGSDGIRLANGEAMAYEVVFPAWFEGAGTRIFNIIKTNYEDIGVQITRKNVDGAAIRDAIQGPDGKYLDMDMSLSEWAPFRDPDFLLSTFTCGTWGSWNNNGYCADTYDAAYKDQAATPILEDRLAKVHALQKTAFDLHTQIALSYPNFSYAHSPEWTGFSSTSQGWFGIETTSLVDVRPVE